MKRTARMIAVDAGMACRKNGAWSDGYLKAAIKKEQLSSRDAALATHICYGVLQNRALLDYYIGCYCSQTPEHLEPILLEILRVGAYQILFLDRVPDRAAVGEAVDLCRVYDRERATGIVNAVLRKIVDRKSALPTITGSDEIDVLSVLYSHPKWLVQRLCKLLGREEGEKFLRCDNQPVPTTIQANPLRGTEGELLQMLSDSGVDVQPHPWLLGCYTLNKTGNMEILPPFMQGRFLVQDAAAKMAAMAAKAESGMRILDLCAAPGGKSFALAMETNDQINLTSFDLHPSKIKLIRMGAKRLGIESIHAMQGDAKQFCADLEQAADIVLCDVPCSGLGIIRKKPDIRYKKETDLRSLPHVQREILDNACRYVKPGGVLLYSTCTILPEENEGVVNGFLRNHTKFHREAFSLPDPIGQVADGQITLWPQRQETDVFYICRMRKD